MSVQIPSAAKVIDTTADVSVVASALRSLGVESIFGYLNPLGQTAKVVTPTRARAIAAAGLRLGLVSEGWGDFAHGGLNAAAGTRDANNFLRQAPLLGAPGGCTGYFAVDVDATYGQIMQFVMPYFSAIRKAFDGAYAVGVYGSGAVCESLGPALVDARWLAQSTGWLRSREFALTSAWTLKQGPATRLAGIDCDPNVVQPNAVVGDFVPFAAAAPAVAAAPSVVGVAGGASAGESA